MKSQNRNAIGYLRTAVKVQSADALIRQEQEIKAYCETNGLILLRVFVDNGASGLNFNRRGWSDMKDYLIDHRGDARYLVIADMARISRSFSLFREEVKVLEKELNVKICSVKEPVSLLQTIKKRSVRIKR